MKQILTEIITSLTEIAQSLHSRGLEVTAKQITENIEKLRREAQLQV